MRAELCKSLVKRARDRRMVFLTGDLGFMALEPLKEAMGPRFINCGVAEQNMISVAAAMCREGLEVWTYTIAPFCYARAFEQIRNDVCFHGLPVKLLANGGGYGYGVMGPTHHALEDYGTLLTLPGMRIFVPAFDEDVEQTVVAAARASGPCYVRLGRGELPKGADAPPYAAWRRLLDGALGVVVVVGPLAGSALGALKQIDYAQRPALWVVSELPLDASPMPPPLIERLERDGRLVVIEEHVAQGGCGQALCHWLTLRGTALKQFRHLAARACPAGTYGSQAFLRKCVGLDPDSIRSAARALAA